MNNFYVYMYLRTNDSKNGKAGTPYYVGKGKGMRAFDKNHRCKPPSDRANIIFVAQNLSEPDAHAEEKHLIAIYGRIDIGTGCLANLTDGGEGLCGHIPWNRGKRGSQVAWNKGKKLPPWTDEQRAAHVRGHEKFVPWNKGTKGLVTWGFPKGTIPPSRKGVKMSEASRQKMSIARAGKKMQPWTEERRAKVHAIWKTKWIAAGRPKLRKCRSNRYAE